MDFEQGEIKLSLLYLTLKICIILQKYTYIKLQVTQWPIVNHVIAWIYVKTISTSRTWYLAQYLDYTWHKATSKHYKSEQSIIPNTTINIIITQGRTIAITQKTQRDNSISANIATTNLKAQATWITVTEITWTTKDIIVKKAKGINKKTQLINTYTKDYWTESTSWQVTKIVVREK